MVNIQVNTSNANPITSLISPASYGSFPPPSSHNAPPLSPNGGIR